MINLMPDFEKAARDVGRLRELLAKAQKLKVDPILTEQMGSLEKALGETLGEARQALVGAQAKLNEDIQGVQGSMERTRQQTAEVRAKVEAFEAAPASEPPAVDGQPLDPLYGETLCAELVERFGPARGVAAEALETGAVSDLSVAQFPEDAPPPLRDR